MAMGSPFSPEICNMFMEEPEENAISTFENKPIIWKRYVDDIFFIWPGNNHSIEEFYNQLNLYKMRPLNSSWNWNYRVVCRYSI
jgi:hypothetical protein